MTTFTILVIFLTIAPISYQIALQRGARNFNLNLSIDIPELIGNLMKGQTTQGPPRPLQKATVVEPKQPQPQPPQGTGSQALPQALRAPVATIRPPSGPGAPAPPPHPVASQHRDDHHHRDEDHHGSQSQQHDQQQSATPDDSPDDEPATRMNSHKNSNNKGPTQTDVEDPEADIHAPPPGRVPQGSKSHAKAPVQQSGSRQSHQQQHPRFDMSIQADPPQKMRGLY